MSRTTLGVWAIVLAAGVFAMLSTFFRARRHPSTLTRRGRVVRGAVLAVWLVAAILTPILGHDGSQPLLTSFVAEVVVACVAVGLVDFLD